jgi:hypothetical protein
MDSSIKTLERAFQLARSGEVRSNEEIKKALKREGYNPAYLYGRALQKQLNALMKKANSATPGIRDERRT